MSCNCNSGDTPEYYITLDGVGADGYSPEINIINEDTKSFELELVNKNNTQITSAIPKLTYLEGTYVSNSSLASTLANYSTTAQIATTYLPKSDAVTTYLKVDGSNANNPITINNLSIQSIGTGTRIGSSGGALTLQGSGVRPAYLQTGSTSKSLALYTDLPTKTSQLTNDSGFLTATDITNKMETDGSNAANTVSLKNIQLSGNISSTETEFKIQNNNGDISITSAGSIYLDTGSSGNLYYDAKEVATVDQIPTVNNATITITQGGVTKGSFTLNQSGSATIALESGGSTIGNQISLITEDNTRSLTLGVDNTTKKVIASYDLISEGTPYLTLPIKLISSATAPILMSESSANGLYNIDLDYDTNSLDVDTNNKLTVDSDYIEAHKAYLADGDTLTDPQGLEYVKYYNYSSFDKSKFTTVGSLSIIDGIASGFTSQTNYLTSLFTSTTPTTSIDIWTKVIITNTSETLGVYCAIDGNLRLARNSASAIGLRGFSGALICDVTGLTLALNDEVIIHGNVTTTGATVDVWVNGVKSSNTVTSTNTISIAYSHLVVGGQYSNGNYSPSNSIDLKYQRVLFDGVEVFSGNKTGIDTYTIDSDTITIPYKLSKTGSKIVDSSRRPEVEAVYEDQGYAPYYTLDETNGNFTLPMGEIYGYITRLEGIVKDLQTRLTALESNIDAGGAGVVQQSLLGMSPLSLSRPQLLGTFNPEDEMNTMAIEPIEDDIQEEELEPQETEEETEEGGEDE